MDTNILAAGWVRNLLAQTSLIALPKYTEAAGETWWEENLSFVKDLALLLLLHLQQKEATSFSNRSLANSSFTGLLVI